MKRKAIQLANNTLVVSLPAKWAQQNSIAKGAELDVDVKDSILIIRKDASSGVAANTARIDISGMSASLVWNYLNAIYRTGVNEIDICFSEPSVKDIKTGKTFKTMDIISRITDKLIGMEIIQQSRSSCTIKEITSLKGDEYTNVMNRIFLSVMTMAKDVLSASEAKDGETLENLYMYSEINLNKLSDYCMRILNIQGLKDFRESNMNYLMTFLLEEVGDVYANIARVAADSKGVVLKHDDLEFFRQTNDLIALSHKFFLNPKIEYYVDFHEQRNLLKKRIDSRLDSAKGGRSDLLFWLKVVLDKLMEINNCKVTLSS